MKPLAKGLNTYVKIGNVQAKSQIVDTLITLAEVVRELSSSLLAT